MAARAGGHCTSSQRIVLHLVYRKRADRLPVDLAPGNSPWISRRRILCTCAGRQKHSKKKTENQTCLAYVYHTAAVL